MNDTTRGANPPPQPRSPLTPLRRAAGARWARRVAVAVALAALGVGLRLTYWAPKSVRVEVALAASGRVERTVTNSRAGTVRARRRSHLSPETSGRVVALPHRAGDRVEAGAVVLRLDDRSQRARVAAAESALTVATVQVREARLQAERAERELDRAQKLAHRGLITDDQLDALQSAQSVARAACETGAARVEQARGEVALAETELAKCVLAAPFAGVVAQVNAELGEWVTPALPAAAVIPTVIDLIDPGSIYVSAPMDEVDSAVIASGLPVRVTLDPYPDRSFVGRVVRVAAYVLDVEAQNRTVEIEVALEDQAFAAGLLPGTSADVEVILETRDDVLRIPAAALTLGRRVLELVDGEVVEREVEVGIRNWDWVEVRAGLAPGARVITTLAKEVQPGVAAVAPEAPGAP